MLLRLVMPLPGPMLRLLMCQVFLLFILSIACLLYIMMSNLYVVCSYCSCLATPSSIPSSPLIPTHVFCNTCVSSFTDAQPHPFFKPSFPDTSSTYIHSLHYIPWRHVIVTETLGLNISVESLVPSHSSCSKLFFGSISTFTTKMPSSIVVAAGTFYLLALHKNQRTARHDDSGALLFSRNTPSTSKWCDEEDKEDEEE